MSDRRRRDQPLPRLWLRHALLVGAALGAGLLALLSYELGALSSIEGTTIDMRFSLRGTEPPGGGVVIVAFDQPTLNAFDKRYPIPRSYYAQLLDRLHADHPRLIAMDVQFDGKTDPTDDNALLAAVARDGPVVLATQDYPDVGPLPVPAGVRNAPGAVQASAAVESDSDGIYRHMIYAAVRLPTFAVVIAGLLHHPVSRQDFPDNQAWVDFRGPPGTFPRYSMVSVLDGRVPPSVFTHKTVLVGITDPIGKDTFLTAASPVLMPGVELQANALTTILEGFPLQSLGTPLEIALLFAMAAISPLISVRRSSLFAVLCAIGVLVVFLFGVQLAFDRGTIVSVPDPILALALGTVGAVAVEAFVQRRQLHDLQYLFDLLPGSSDFFLSYRREQSELAANTLKAGLARRFGEEHVFMDTDAIQPGEAWPQRIEQAIESCRAMLVVIGPQWVETEDPRGNRRLDDPSDWVRREVAAGLERAEAVVVPVLHDGAREPRSEELPEPLQPLATCQAVQLSGRDFDQWIDELVERIQKGKVRATTLGAGSA